MLGVRPPLHGEMQRGRQGAKTGHRGGFARDCYVGGTRLSEPQGRPLFALMPPSETAARAARAQRFVESLYADATDLHGLPAVEHMRQVAAGCEGELKVLGWLHDVVEDGKADPELLRRDLSLSEVEVEALGLLTRPSSLSYGDYIERIASTGGEAGEIARKVKLTDLRVNLARPPHPTRPDLRERYLRALAQLGG